MSKDGFREYLAERKLGDDQIAAAISLVERFEASSGAPLEEAGREQLNAFAAQMIEQKVNEWDHFITLLRYAAFIKNDDIYVAALELIDGAEALETLHRKLAEEIGEAERDRIFEGIDLPELGTTNNERPILTHTVIERMAATIDREVCIRILGSGLRYLEDAWYLDAKRKYEEAGSLDAYLEIKGDEYIAELEKHRDEGTLYFNQRITQQVIDYVEAHPEIRQGVRDGNILYETKIPHQAIEFLAETDPKKKTYHYCHCPWVKESLKGNDFEIDPVFCNCSAAFHKKSWEVIFGRPLEAEVLESVLNGDPWCRFAIHLPDDIVSSEDIVLSEDDA